MEVETELKNWRAYKCGIKEEEEKRLGGGQLSYGLILRTGGCHFLSIASSLLGERPMPPFKGFNFEIWHGKGEHKSKPMNLPFKS